MLSPNLLKSLNWVNLWIKMYFLNFIMYISALIKHEIIIVIIRLIRIFSMLKGQVFSTEGLKCDKILTFLSTCIKYGVH